MLGQRVPCAFHAIIPRGVSGDLDDLAVQWRFIMCGHVHRERTARGNLVEDLFADCLGIGNPLKRGVRKIKSKGSLGFQE
jgi:hypothetical protein